MALYDEYLAQNKSLLDYFGGLKGTSTGLSPETTAGLRTLALDSVPAQFERTERDLFTQLQRQNPAGLPAGGEYLRAFAPLEAAKETQRSNLLRDLMLENEAEKRRTLDVNNRLAFDAAGQYGNLGLSLLGEDLAQGRFESGQALTREQNELERANRLAVAELANEPGSFKSLLLASLLGAGTAPGAGGQSLIGKGIDAVAGLFGGGGGGAASTASDLGGLILAGAGTAGGAAAGGAAAGGAAGGAATGGGLGSTLAGLATNPITIAAAAALGGALLWKKSQVHPTADKWVQGFQNPFDSAMAAIDKEVVAGQLGPDIAAEFKRRNVVEYLTTLQQFASQGSKENTVAKQALSTFKQWYGDPQNYGVSISL